MLNTEDEDKLLKQFVLEMLLLGCTVLVAAAIVYFFMG